MRLQQYLAQCGVASRRKSEELIRGGRIWVNGRLVTEMGVSVQDGDLVTFDGVQVWPQTEKEYILLNKPMDVMTTHNDPQKRKTVYEYVADIPVRLFSVGRLDYDTEGALLMTNDGAWANAIMHPRFEVEKRYLAHVKGMPTPEALNMLRQGVTLDDGFVTSPAKVRIRGGDVNAHVEIIIHEGQNRQVKRMMQQIGHTVLHLKREAIGSVSVQGLSAGAWRRLTGAEIAQLGGVDRAEG